MRTLVLLLVPALIVVAGCASEKPEAPPPASTGREDTTSFTIRASDALEYKLNIAEGASITFDWKATKPVNFDFHGNAPGDPDDYTSHKKGTLASHASTFTAPFDGEHGWWWQNEYAEPVTVTLHTKGTYTIKGITSGG